MINFEIHHNLFDLEDLNLESSISALNSRDKAKIDSVNVLQVKERAYLQRDMASLFRNFIAFCMKEQNVYLVLAENYPEMKSRIRTKKGLFYKHKGQFGKDGLFETEIEVSPDETLFAGIIRMTDDNVDYVLSCINDFQVAFGLISPSGKRTYRTNRKDFLETVVYKGLTPGKIYWKNWLKLASLLIKPGRRFFYLQDINDTEHLRVFYHKDDREWARRLENMISQELQVKPVSLI